MLKRAVIFGLGVAVSGCVPDEPAKGKGGPVAAPAPAPPPPPPVLQAPLPQPAPPAEPPDPPLTGSFTDDFERPALGPDWRATSGVWKIDGGKLCGRSARNHGVWLKRRLPVNARIEFDATSASPEGDLKLEVWGDGRSHATGVSYTNATSYVVIFGGWKNQFHVLARIDEHARDRKEVRLDPAGADLRTRRVEAGRQYRFKIERSDGKTVRWWVDNVEIHSYADPAPLSGEGHEHMGFNDWEVPVCFDNLKVEPLTGN
ncbi:MAG: hypothetical protein R3B13_16030 [Polyangiaceae bacterium]